MDASELAEVVGPALAVALDGLEPPERLAFLLHDVFAVPLDEVAAVLGTSPAVIRTLSARGRRRLRGPAPTVGTESTEAPGPIDGTGPSEETGPGAGTGVPAGSAPNAHAVEAFVAAARGDFAGLLALLDHNLAPLDDNGA